MRAKVIICVCVCVRANRLFLLFDREWFSEKTNMATLLLTSRLTCLYWHVTADTMSDCLVLRSIGRLELYTHSCGQVSHDLQWKLNTRDLDPFVRESLESSHERMVIADNTHKPRPWARPPCTSDDTDKTLLGVVLLTTLPLGFKSASVRTWTTWHC